MGTSLRRTLPLAAALVTVTALAACTSGQGTTGSTPVNGGVATVAEQVGNSPDYIFPFLSIQYETTSNLTWFQSLMYRPLYWFGVGSSPGINYSLSLADPPSWSDNYQAVTFKLKDYRWSDGAKLTPENVAFWFGLDLTEKANWALYNPGDMPDDISKISYDDRAGTVTLRLKGTVSPSFFLDEELSQITPLPLAWDLTAPGQAGKCASEQQATQRASCPKVYSYLTQQAKDQSAYAGSPLWKVVDGPFRLSSYVPNGEYTMVPNKSYSGPVKPRLSQLKFLPFASDAAEYNELRSGTTISIGTIPSYDLPRKPASVPVGRNPLSGYTMYPVNYWGFQYLLINFNNPTVGPLLRQLYARQVLQTLVDQTVDIQKAYNGYGYASYGPVPRVPPNPFLDAFEARNPYPFSISRAQQILRAHGWTVPSSGTAYCSRPGSGSSECGPGITAGEKFQVKLESFSGAQAVSETMAQYVSDASQAGVDLVLSQVPVHQLLADAVQCKPSQASCGWQLLNYGGVSYPSAYPSGKPYFQTGAGQNIGSYSSPEMDSLIAKTVRSASSSAMSNYENYAAVQIPVIWQPFQTSYIYEVANNLHGVAPFNPLSFSNPANWYFTR
jgi:peptide/nickel transport system substrate-binding protein